MVLYDDKKWLCRLIRTAFTIEDDTGVCEKVLRTKAALPPVGYKQDGDSSSISSVESYDIREGADLGHRRRSNTAIRLEKLDKQKKAQIMTRNIRVNNMVEAPKDQISFEKDSDYLGRVNMCSKRAVPVNRLLEAVPHPESIPFATYAKFDATGHPGTTSCKRIAIFVPFLPEKQREYPLKVAVISTAKVMELVGLTLWMASQEYPGIVKDLRPITYYCLQIADEGGEWDTDFPPMDFAEPVSKFSFSHLALVRCENDHAILSPAQLKISLSFLLPSGSSFRMSVDNTDISLADCLVMLLQRSGWGRGFLASSSAPAKESYHFEKLGDPASRFLDLSISINDAKCKDFCLVRNGAKSIQTASVKTDPKVGFGSSPTEFPGARPTLYPVLVSTGRLKRVKNALCVWSGDRMDLEYQHKVKSYHISNFSGVKFDPMKNRIVISVGQFTHSTAPIQMSAHYLTGASQLTLTTSDRHMATELYHHLISVINNK